MEDMARLAVVEQSVRDEEKFNRILYELLRHINNILENPHVYELRTLKSDILKDVMKCEAFSDYLKYLGFQSVGSKIVYPKELTLSNLKMAQISIERKISFCSGTDVSKLNYRPNPRIAKKIELTPTNILTTRNTLLLKIEDLFNYVLEYEDEELQELAREQIPLASLQLMAIERVRAQQKKIKTGETKDQDLSFDVALLMELLGWFKDQFFSWVDQPPCDICGGTTVFSHRDTLTTENETCGVEVYKCSTCPTGGSRFPRYNDPGTLLRTRRGRCGEWANCFALICRALGYDTRYIYDTTDHVWCEVFDYDSKAWLHADPCEAKLDSPLMYEHGWGKKLSYVIAVSRDDIQDVTWRYTLDHKQTLARRKACSEDELIATLMTLRESRQSQVSGPRRQYLARRTVAELVNLMQQKKPEDYESHGRISGSKQWRSDRGEIGRGHTFEFSVPGPCEVRYISGMDKYWVLETGQDAQVINGWASGVYQSENMFRKVENDWKQAYIAREEGESIGSVSWRFSGRDLRLVNVTLRVKTAIYEDGEVNWTVQFDNEAPETVRIDDNGVLCLPSRACTHMLVRVTCTGGRGSVAWQHAQLCRATLGDKSPSLEFHATLQ